MNSNNHKSIDEEDKWSEESKHAKMQKVAPVQNEESNKILRKKNKRQKKHETESIEEEDKDMPDVSNENHIIESEVVPQTNNTLKYYLNKSKHRLKFFNDLYQIRREQRIRGEWNPVLTNFTKLIFSCPGFKENRGEQIELK